MDSLVSSLTALSSPPNTTFFQKPDTNLAQYEALEGPSAVSLMQADIESVWAYAEPTLGAPVCKPMDVPLLELTQITDLQNGSIEVPSMPDMPSIELGMPSIPADALNAASALYGEVTGAIAAAVPMIGAIQSLVSDIQQLPNLILGEIGNQIASQMGGLLAEISALSPIAVSLQLGAQAMRVHSAISMLANGNISSLSMLSEMSVSIKLGAQLSPSIEAAAGSILSIVSQAEQVLAPIEDAARTVANAASAISALVNNPLGFSASALNLATETARVSIYATIGGLAQ